VINNTKFTCICCVLLVLCLKLFPCLIYCENTFFFVDASFRVPSKLPGSWVLYIRGFKISTKYGNFVFRWHSTNYNTFTDIHVNLCVKTKGNKNVDSLRAWRVSGIIFIMYAQSQNIGKSNNFLKLWEQKNQMA
jgi:hypothetical protein